MIIIEYDHEIDRHTYCATCLVSGLAYYVKLYADFSLFAFEDDTETKDVTVIFLIPFYKPSICH